MKLKNRWRRFFYSRLYGWGNAYYCVFCGKSAARFIPIGSKRPVLKKKNVLGAGKRKNGKCPYCLSNDRARLVYLFLQNKTDIFKSPSRVLHIAPDDHLRKVLEQASTIDYVYGDIGTGPPAMKIDVRNIPFEEASFDYVICNHVLEYVREEEQALREIYRVLRPGKKAILQVPVSLALEKTIEGSRALNKRETIQQFGHSGNVRMYGMDYPDRLGAVGFEVIQHNPLEGKWTPDIKIHALDPRAILFESTKKLQNP